MGENEKTNLLNYVKSKLDTQGPEKHTNIKEYFPEAGFDVLPAVPGRGATFHD